MIMNPNTNRFMFWRSPDRSSVGSSFSAFAQMKLFVLWAGILACATGFAFAQEAQKAPKPQDPPKNVHLLTGEEHADVMKDLASQKEIKTRKQSEAEKEMEPFALEQDQILSDACKQAYKDAGITEVGECQADLSMKDPKTGKQVGGVWPKPKEDPKPAATASTPASPAK